jgi:hypothetical protein
MHGTMQPLHLWRTGFWAARYSCYISGKRSDLVNMAEGLALCLTMLALLPRKGLLNQTMFVKALAREAKRAAQHPPEGGDPQHMFFQAFSATNFPRQYSGPAHQKVASHAGHEQNMMQYRDCQLPGCPLSAAYALLCPSPSCSTSPGKQTGGQITPAASDDEPDPFSSTPSCDSQSADLGLHTAAELLLPVSDTMVEAQRAGEEVDNEQLGRPSQTKRKSPDGPEGALPTAGLPKKGKSGSPPVLDENILGSFGGVPSSKGRSASLVVMHEKSSSLLPAASPPLDGSRSPGPLANAEEESMGNAGVIQLPEAFVKKGSGKAHASGRHQGPQLMQEKRKAGQGGSRLARKVRRCSEDHKVCGLMKCIRYQPANVKFTLETVVPTTSGVQESRLQSCRTWAGTDTGEGRSPSLAKREGERMGRACPPGLYLQAMGHSLDKSSRRTCTV